MNTRTTIKKFDSMREAYSAITTAEIDYLRKNKCKSTIELTLSSTSKPVYDERGKLKLSKEIIEVRAVYDDSIAKHLEEYHWFANNIK